MPLPLDPQLRATVVAELAAGKSLTAAARDHGLGMSTVRQWRDKAGLNPQSIMNSQSDIILPSKIDIGALVFEYIEQGLKALIAQTEVASDPTWIRAQSAGELYLFHGVLADKLQRLLAAIQPAGNRDSAATE